MTATGPSGTTAWSEAAILEHLRRGGPTVVALSGGVDSALVALLAYRALGEEAVAATLTGPSLAREELESARGVVREIGISHVELPVDPLLLPQYRSNPSNRCYFCRSVETKELRRWGDARGFRQYLDGVHLDDLGEDRPGLKAMDEAGFRHPLVVAGWGKAEVRHAARSAGLSNWERPSNACLASRVTHGEELSPELLRRIELSEELVRSFGFRRVRVRVRGEECRVEVDGSEVGRWLDASLGAEVVAGLTRLGFRQVTLDPVGYRPRRGA
jgi:uncharacterized protein